MPHGTWLPSESYATYGRLQEMHAGAPTVIDLPDDRGFLGDLVHGASIVGQAVLGAAVDIVQTPQRIVEDIVPGTQFPELDPEGWGGTQWGGGLTREEFGYTGQPSGGAAIAREIAGTAIAEAFGGGPLGFVAGTVFDSWSQRQMVDTPSAMAGEGTSVFDTGGVQPMANGMQLPQLGWAYQKTNPETGLRYGRLMDGRMVYEKKNGTVTVFRPKKPIVLYPGKVTLSQASRASGMLGTIAKRMKKSKFKAFL